MPPAKRNRDTDDDDEMPTLMNASVAAAADKISHSNGGRTSGGSTTSSSSSSRLSALRADVGLTLSGVPTTFPGAGRTSVGLLGGTAATGRIEDVGGRDELLSANSYYSSLALGSSSLYSSNGTATNNNPPVHHQQNDVGAVGRSSSGSTRGRGTGVVSTGLPTGFAANLTILVFNPLVFYQVSGSLNTPGRGSTTTTTTAMWSVPSSPTAGGAGDGGFSSLEIQAPLEVLHQQEQQFLADVAHAMNCRCRFQVVGASELHLWRKLAAAIEERFRQQSERMVEPQQHESYYSNNYFNQNEQQQNRSSLEADEDEDFCPPQQSWPVGFPINNGDEGRALPMTHPQPPADEAGMVRKRVHYAVFAAPSSCGGGNDDPPALILPTTGTTICPGGIPAVRSPTYTTHQFDRSAGFGSSNNYARDHHPHNPGRTGGPCSPQTRTSPTAVKVAAELDHWVTEMYVKYLFDGEGG